ncbi:hypothetical protein HanPI659440_Chr08g0290231 [Helianthus annuus]|nr:hypothetical protein HanPI659440_Chr08g0290231 [Helianthus annuus]
MGRTGKSKGKEAAGSSSQPEAEAQQKRRNLIRVGDPNPEEEAPPRAPKPKWTSGSLLDQLSEWQTELFHDQMNDFQQRKEAFFCERDVRESNFGPFGITDKFKALGWEPALKSYDRESKNLYDAEIQEWMATLRCPPFKAPSKIKLTGTVNNIDVEMSYDSLRRIAKFDRKPTNQYIFPRLEDLYFNPQKHPQWNNMLNYLFLPGTTSGKLYRRNLRIEAKLMLVVCTQNVIPRRGDKVEVRFAKVPLLYMLLHRSPLVPFRFLVLNNIWIGQNSEERKIIPHCRLITALLKLYGAIRAKDKGSYKRFKPFDLKNLGPGWEYKEWKQYHKLGLVFHNTHIYSY